MHQEEGDLRVYECSACEKMYYHNESLKQHIKKYHEESVKDSVQCKSCSKTLKNKYMLKEHVRRIHDAVKNFKCEACGMSFVTAEELESHCRNIHMNIKPTRCDICNKDVKGSIKKHVRRTHEDNGKVITCLTCSKTFKTNSEVPQQKYRFFYSFGDQFDFFL